MGTDQYDVKANRPRTTFSFISEGPKGKILKQVQYSKMKIKGRKNIYNLAFGDINDGINDIDDQVITDNNDREKVLATVINTIYAFTKHHPKATIFFSGSTASRTRLYQMAIAKFYNDFSDEFSIKGLVNREFVDFEKNKHYLAFLITRKINQL